MVVVYVISVYRSTNLPHIRDTNCRHFLLYVVSHIYYVKHPWTSDRYRQFLSVIGQLNKIFSKATWPN
jgi:hypothetical protein